MRNYFLAAAALGLLAAGCTPNASGLRASGSSNSQTDPPPPNVNPNCDPILPSHSAMCDRVRAESTDLDDQIAALQASLQGPPHPTGPERATIMGSIRTLQTQKRALGTRLASCDGRTLPRRPLTPDVSVYLTQVGPDPAATLTLTPIVQALPPDGILSQIINGRELELKFTQSGCAVQVVSVPIGRFKKTGFLRDFLLAPPNPAAPLGTYHPITGALDFAIDTTLTSDVGVSDHVVIRLTTDSSVGGRNVDAAGNVVLVSKVANDLRGGNIASAIGVEQAKFRFEGKFSQPPPR